MTQGENQGAGISRLSIRTWLLIVAMAAAVPFLVILIFDTFHDHRWLEAEATRQAGQIARMVATEAESLAEETRPLLAYYAARPLVRALDPERCDPLLAEFTMRRPQYANLITVDMRGRIVCAATDLGGTTRFLSDPDNVLGPLRASPDFAWAEKPVRGSLSRRWILPSAQAIQDDQGKTVGAAALALDLAHLAPDMARVLANDGSVAWVITGAGIVLSRSYDFESWVGRDVSGSDVIDAAKRQRAGAFRGAGYDGIDRLWGFAEVAGTDWIAAVGVPSQVALRDSREEAIKDSLGAFSAMAIALVLCFIAYSRIAPPMLRLSEVVHRAREGDLAARAVPEGPVEVRVFAQAFNRAMDAFVESREALDGQRAFMQAVIDGAPVSISVKDHQGRFLFVNENTARLMGASSRDFVGKTSVEIARLFPQMAALYRSRAEILRMQEEVQRTGKAMTHISLGPLEGGGSPRYLQVSVVPVRIAKDRTGIASIVVDVTESRSKEVELRKLTQVVEQAQASIVITNGKGDIEYVNPWFERLTGYRAEEARGKNPRMLKSGDTPPEAYRKLWETISAGRTWTGEFRNLNRYGDSYWETAIISPVVDDQDEITHFVAIKVDITAQKLAEERAQRLINYDVLTGLPNRVFLRERIEATIEHKAVSAFAVLHVDLDNFKHANDSLGHAFGDRLLIAIAQRIGASMGEGELVGRLGGDEFTAVLPGLGDPEAVAVRARQLMDVVAQPIIIEGNEFHLGCSVGAALYPRDGTTAEELLRNADAALHQAKAEGRLRVAFYAQVLSDKAAETFTLAAAIRRGVDRGEFSLVYQPQYNMVDRTLCGIEALARWRNPELGQV
ncbi:MAG: diguanylate cyclase [Alphaproteobacteria bacterium]|nr:diguanylate cyclase [Alphaproteobacteria bacterium]